MDISGYHTMMRLSARFLLSRRQILRTMVKFTNMMPLGQAVTLACREWQMFFRRMGMIL